MGRLLSLAEAEELAALARQRGERVVLANGCFDLLHVGHVRYLEAARRLGDVCLVAINSDRSVRALKGPGRPVVSEADRASVVGALEAVDAAFVFDAPDVRGLLERLRPAVHAKGTDYSVDSVPERETSRALGIEVAIVGDAKDHAAGTLIERLRRGR